MKGLAKMVREQAQRAAQQVRQAFRAVAASNTQDSITTVQMEGLAGESVSGELIQHYGFTSAPLPGAEYIVIPVGGNSNHAVVVASEDGRYRLKIKDGEVALYTDEGDCVHMKRGRVIEIETETLHINASKLVRFETPLIETTGDMKAAGDIEDHTRTMQADRVLYNKHKHGSSPTPDAQQ